LGIPLGTKGALICGRSPHYSALSEGAYAAGTKGEQKGR